MAEVLWGRQVFFDVGREGQATAKRYEGFRTSFDVTMTRGSALNQGQFKIWLTENVKNEIVGVLQETGSVFRLFAGYAFPRQIFVGNPLRKDGVKASRQAGGWVLDLKAKDGGDKYRTARVSLSYTTAVKFSRVVADVADQLGFDRGRFVVQVDFEYPNGITLEGRAGAIMDRLASSARSDWFIQDDAIHMIPSNEDSGEDIIVFSRGAKNLVGSPATLDHGRVEATALLAPDMRPARRFEVISNDVSGIYTADEVRFIGDSGFAKPYYVKCKGTPI